MLIYYILYRYFILLFTVIPIEVERGYSLRIVLRIIIPNAGWNIYYAIPTSIWLLGIQ